MLPEIVRYYSESAGVSIKMVTNVWTVCEALNVVPGAKGLCSELHRLQRFFLTIPVTIASSEGTFLAMQKLKLTLDL